jgi:chromate reductase, NAD(P)H dehydrogenase (quinone)
VNRVLAIAGSLRHGSFNRLLLRAAAEVAPQGMSIHSYDNLGAVPLFNADHEQPPPDGVQQFRAAVAAADGILIATPEYNWSIPGVLKNAIDWLSRPLPDEPLIGKPVGIIGATTGSWGTRLSQAALRQVLCATESLVLPAPALFVRNAATVFDEAGHLTEESTRNLLRTLLQAFQQWIGNVRH